MNRRFLFISPMTSLSSLIFVLVCFFCLMTKSFKADGPPFVNLPQSNPPHICGIGGGEENYDLFFPNDGKMYIHYSQNPENEFVTYENNWEKCLDKNLPAMRTFDKRARFYLYMSQDSPYSEFEKLMDVLRKHGIYTIFHVVVQDK